MNIKTQRLELKAMDTDALAPLTDLLTDAVVQRTYMIPDFADRSEAEQMARRLVKLSQDPERNIVGMFANGRFVGMLNQTEANGRSVEVGYAILPCFHGQGYATEALIGAIPAFFAQGFQEVVAGAFEENAASIRVMCKSGMTRLDRQNVVSYRGRDHRCVYYCARKPGE